jgi:hypothetical protein
MTTKQPLKKEGLHASVEASWPGSRNKNCREIIRQQNLAIAGFIP